MAGQNRGNYSTYNGRGSGLSLVRGAFVMLVVLILSFGLGFFVIARLMPGNAKPEGESGLAGGAPGSSGQPDRAAAGGSTVQQPPAAAAVAAQAPAKPAADNGPSFTAPQQEKVQRPTAIDGGGSSADGSDAASPGASGSGAGPDRSAAGHGAPGDSSSPADSPSGRSQPGARGASGSAEPGVQSPGSPDQPNPGGAAADPGAAQNPQSPDAAGNRAPGSGLYRVQLGVFSTRVKAQEIARDARDKGFRARVRAVSQDGRTLYRVQYSARRTRAGAEADLQKLTSAGLDATIINPQP